MKKLGLVLGLLGILVSIGSFVLFGSAIKRATADKKVAKVPLGIGVKKVTDLIEVNPNKFCQVVIEMDIHPQSIRKRKDPFDDEEVEYEAKCHFPLSYRVLDEQGKEIHSQKTHVGTYTSDEELTPEDTVPIRHVSEKFKVPGPGKIKVEVEIGQDDKYQTQADTVELIVYDNVSTYAKSVVSGIMMFLIGPVLTVGGVILFITGLENSEKIKIKQWITGANQREFSRSMNGTVSAVASEDEKKWAMFCHLSTFLGFIPFGNIAGPFVI